MDIFMVLALLGGLAFFLYGMTAMSNGLEKMAGSKLEVILRKLTSNKFKGLILGIGVTAVIQSSSAVTVMLVGLVNSGVMKFSQAISVIMGSNIGTTMTAWLLSLTGIESSNVFLSLLKPINFSTILAFVGIVLIMAAKSEKKRDMGSIFIGFAILMFGMNMMSDAVEPLADMPQFTSLLTAFSNPILGVLVGTIFTAVIQSSSASVGVLQALSMTGALTYGSVVPVIMGQNIGTCVSALLASLGTNKNAKRVAIVHVLFNFIGTVVFLCIWTVATSIFDIALVNEVVKPHNIAIVHSIFNFSATILLFPFIGVLEKLACIIIKDTDEKEQKVLLDDRLMTVPSVAVGKAFDVTVKMSGHARDAVTKALSLFDKYDQKIADEVVKLEGKTDHYEDELSNYLLKLSALELPEHDENSVSKMLHTINDFERIGDHAMNLGDVAKEIHTKQINFSDGANTELQTLYRALSDILSTTISAFEKNDVSMAKTVEPLEDVIDTLVLEIKNRHIKRLRAGNCTIEIGFILTDLLTNIERISDHCSNIAVAVIEADLGSFESHEYLDNLKHTSVEFASNYDKLLKEYAI